MRSTDLRSRAMAVHPNSLANLGPAWQPGQSGNPNGRVPIGLSYQEWLNVLDTHDADGVAKYDQAALEQIRDDPTQARSKRAAAADLLDMPRTDYEKAIPMRANSIDRVSDRTVGRPVQSVMVQHTQPDDPVALREQLRQMLTNEPELCSLLGDLAPVDALPVVVETIDAEGVEAQPPAPDAPASP